MTTIGKGGTYHAHRQPIAVLANPLKGELEVIGLPKITEGTQQLDGHDARPRRDAENRRGDGRAVPIGVVGVKCAALAAQIHTWQNRTSR